MSWHATREVANWVARMICRFIDYSKPFPLYVARIDEGLLLRPTPDGVRLTPNF